MFIVDAELNIWVPKLDWHILGRSLLEGHSSRSVGFFCYLSIASSGLCTGSWLPSRVPAHQRDSFVAQAITKPDQIGA